MIKGLVATKTGALRERIVLGALGFSLSGVAGAKWKLVGRMGAVVNLVQLTTNGQK
jgi:hypothetical protein